MIMAKKETINLSVKQLVKLMSGDALTIGGQPIKIVEIPDLGALEDLRDVIDEILAEAEEEDEEEEEEEEEDLEEDEDDEEVLEEEDDD
jgi:hypothetical protein